jgi:hypothetical protein
MTNLLWALLYFTTRSRIFHLYGDVTIASEWLQNLGLCSVFRAFEQGGIFIVSHLLIHRALVFPVSSEECPIQSPLTTHKGLGMWRIYSMADPHHANGSPFSRFWQQARGCWGPTCTLSRILMCLLSPQNFTITKPSAWMCLFSPLQDLTNLYFHVKILGSDWLRRLG